MERCRQILIGFEVGLGDRANTQGGHAVGSAVRCMVAAMASVAAAQQILSVEVHHAVVAARGISKRQSGGDLK